MRPRERRDSGQNDLFKARCRFTLEPETGTIWVRIGTEIETGASFSLNLSANFIAPSGESSLLFDCGLPGFDEGV